MHHHLRANNRQRQHHHQALFPKARPASVLSTSPGGGVGAASRAFLASFDSTTTSLLTSTRLCMGPVCLSASDAVTAAAAGHHSSSPSGSKTDRASASAPVSTIRHRHAAAVGTSMTLSRASSSETPLIVSPKSSATTTTTTSFRTTASASASGSSVRKETSAAIQSPSSPSSTSPAPLPQLSSSVDTDTDDDVAGGLETAPSSLLRPPPTLTGGILASCVSTPQCQRRDARIDQRSSLLQDDRTDDHDDWIEVGRSTTTGAIVTEVLEPGGGFNRVSQVDDDDDDDEEGEMIFWDDADDCSQGSCKAK